MVEHHLKILLEKTLQELSIDCVIFGFHAGELKVLLLRWKATDGVEPARRKDI
jgi:8-oxo-dGTP diphosphatase